MDLEEVRGIGPAFKEKLVAAGIRSAEELAWADDLPRLAEATGIPPRRLATLQAEAARSAGRAPRPPVLAFRSMLGAVAQFARSLRAALAR